MADTTTNLLLPRHAKSYPSTSHRRSPRFRSERPTAHAMAELCPSSARLFSPTTQAAATHRSASLHVRLYLPHLPEPCASLNAATTRVVSGRCMAPRPPLPDLEQRQADHSDGPSQLAIRPIRPDFSCHAGTRLITSTTRFSATACHLASAARIKPSQLASLRNSTATHSSTDQAPYPAARTRPTSLVPPRLAAARHRSAHRLAVSARCSPTRSTAQPA